MSSAYSCELCREGGRSFTVPVDEIGAAVMQQHLKSEHGIAFVSELQACAECGQHVLCTLGNPRPSTCREHS